jgi:WD domain, G-beta repeat
VELQLDGRAGAPTDESLVQFAQLPVLRKLVLRYDEPARRYTPAGIAEFRRLRPDVQLIADGQEFPALAATPEGPDDVFSPPLVRPGQPLSDVAVVSRPATISGVRSWSVEPKSPGVGITSVAWSPRGDMIATCSWGDNSVRLWDRDGNLKSVLLGHTGSVTSVAFSPDGKLLASCTIFFGVAGTRGEVTSGQPTLRLWDTETGKCVARVPTGMWCWMTAFSPAGERVAVCGANAMGFVGVLELKSGGFSKTAIEGNVEHVAWSPDEQRLVVARPGRLGPAGQAQVLDAQTLKPVGELSAGNDATGKPLAVGGPVYSPDGHWIAAVGRDRQVHLWDGASLKHVKTVPTTVNGVGDVPGTKAVRNWPCGARVCRMPGK